MNIILNIHHWVNLSAEVRQRIRMLFNIPRSSNTVVNDGKLETDGTTIQDFEHLTTEKMQKFVHSDLTDFYKLFDLTVAQVLEDIENKVPTSFKERPVAEVLKQAEEIINAKPKSNGKKKQVKEGNN